MGKKKRSMPQVNSTSSADMAFMLLLFFMLTTSMDTDMGMPRKLPPPPDKSIQVQTDLKIKKRNILQIMINTHNQILCGGEYIEIRQLKDKVKAFIQNETNDENMPEKVPTDVPLFGTMDITSNHVISLQNDRGTAYQAYVDVQNELAAAYTELRNDVSRNKWGKNFADLTEDLQEIVQKIYPQKISEAEPKNYGDKK